MLLRKRMLHVLSRKTARGRQPLKAFTRLLAEPLENRIVPSVDLVPVLVNAPEVGSQKEVIHVETQIDNVGSTPSRRNEVRFVISLDDKLDASDRTLATVRRRPLAAGASDHWRQEI